MRSGIGFFDGLIVGVGVNLLNVQCLGGLVREECVCGHVTALATGQRIWLHCKEFKLPKQGPTGSNRMSHE